MLEQMVASPIRGQNIIDLFFTPNPTFVGDISVCPGLSDQNIVMTKVNIKPEVIKGHRPNVTRRLKCDTNCSPVIPFSK